MTSSYSIKVNDHRHKNMLFSYTTILKFSIIPYTHPLFQFTDLSIGMTVLGANHFVFSLLQVDEL